MVGLYVAGDIFFRRKGGTHQFFKSVGEGPSAGLIISRDTGWITGRLDEISSAVFNLHWNFLFLTWRSLLKSKVMWMLCCAGPAVLFVD